MTLTFSWDQRKDLNNQKKHNIPFEEAQSIFFDENALLIYDPDHSHDEDRFILLGLISKFRLIIVSHCYQKNNSVIRIISARKATNKEQKKYKEAL